jgi:hypothetical protein
MPKARPLQKTKLSKKFFMGLEEGLFLVSNCTDEHCKPIFADEVCSLNIRAMQWQMIVDCRAHHRLCEIFQSRAYFDEVHFNWLLKWRI